MRAGVSGFSFCGLDFKMAGIEALDFEEDLAVGRSSRADTKFDTTVGHIEDIIMEDRFQSMMQHFMEEHYHHFEEAEENKLVYTDIFKKYVNLVENHIETELCLRIPGFKMEEFTKSLQKREDQIGGEIFDMLLSFTDFLAFKQMILDYKADKEGRSLDLSGLITISSSCKRPDVEDSQDMQVDPHSPREEREPRSGSSNSRQEKSPP